MKSQIFHKLNNFFKPEVLKVINESHLHSNHSQSPNTGNSHFFIEIKSDLLTSISRIEGQRLIYETLSEEMNSKIHALRIKIIYN